MKKLVRGAGGVLIERRQVLLVKEKETNENYFKREGMLSIPLGVIGREIKKETPAQAIEREFLEETGYRVEAKNHLASLIMPGNPIAVGEIFLVILGRIRDKIQTSELETVWMDIRDLFCMPECTVRPPTKAAVLHAQNWLYWESQRNSR